MAMDMAACQKSVSLFAEAAAQETVDVEERRRLESIPVSFEGLITVADFCPYLQMSHDNNNNNNTGSNTGVMVNDNERRQRRKAIAKLCRTNPIWILLPMNPLGKLYDEDAMEGDPPRGTTALHVAVRSRNVTLVQLLMKYCRKAAEISDGDGCLPLHYAVRPPDEFGVLRRALTNMGSPANENNWTDPMGAMSFGLNLQYRAKSYFKAIQ